MYVSFNLESTAVGTYNVIAQKANNEITILENAFEIVEGESGKLIVITDFPRFMPGITINFKIMYENQGNTDILNPFAVLKSLNGMPISFTKSDLRKDETELQLHFTELKGPPNVLRPGAKGSIIIFTEAELGIGFSIKY